MYCILQAIHNQNTMLVYPDICARACVLKLIYKGYSTDSHSGNTLGWVYLQIGSDIVQPGQSARNLVIIFDQCTSSEHHLSVRRR